MNTIQLAKNIWKRATTLKGPGQIPPYFTTSPMYHYQGILTMFAGAQAAVAAKDQEWIKEVNSYLAKYPHHFEDPDICFNYSFDNYRVGGLGKGWSVMKGYFQEYRNPLPGRKHQEQVFFCML